MSFVITKLLVLLLANLHILGESVGSKVSAVVGELMGRAVGETAAGGACTTGKTKSDKCESVNWLMHNQ